MNTGFFEKSWKLIIFGNLFQKEKKKFSRCSVDVLLTFSRCSLDVLKIFCRIFPGCFQDTPMGLVGFQLFDDPQLFDDQLELYFGHPVSFRPKYWETASISKQGHFHMEIWYFLWGCFSLATSIISAVFVWSAFVGLMFQIQFLICHFMKDR